jgi:hypothetical protein
VLAKQAINHSGGRGFTVGAGYVNDSVKLLRVTEQSGGASGWLKAWSKLVFRHASHKRLLNVFYGFDQSFATEI